MPLKTCSAGGKSGYKWGDGGKCFTGPDAKEKALAQGRAIEANKKKVKEDIDMEKAERSHNWNTFVRSLKTFFEAEAPKMGPPEPKEPKEPAKKLDLYDDDWKEKPSKTSTSEEVHSKVKTDVDDSKDSMTVTVNRESNSTFTRTVSIKSVDKREWIIYGVVMQPTAEGELTEKGFSGKVLSTDTDSEFTTEAEIRKAMIGFMEALAKEKYEPHNLSHGDTTLSTAIIENYQTSSDCEIGGETVLKGSWVQGTKVYDEEMRKAITNGEITGYSIEGAMRLAPIIE
jgi:hypothetical protein